MGNIEKLWQSYKSNVIAANASDIQLIEMRRAFYAGVTALKSILDSIAEEDIPEDHGVIIIQGIDIELNNFTDLVKNGRA